MTTQATYRRAATAAEHLNATEIRGETIHRGAQAARRARDLIHHDSPLAPPGTDPPAAYDTNHAKRYTLGRVSPAPTRRTASTDTSRGTRRPTRAHDTSQPDHPRQSKTSGVERSQETYNAAATAAERLDPAEIRGGTIHRGKAATTRGRQIIADATSRPGRPNLDPDATPGQRSRTYALRLPQPLAADLDTYLDAHPDETFSSVMRQALTTHLQDPTTADQATARRTQRSQVLRENLDFYQAHPDQLDRAITLLAGLLGEALEVPVRPAESIGKPARSR